MKYHKIRKIEKTVCAAEQMIAYNIAFRQHISYQHDFDIATNYEAIGKVFPALL